MASQFIPLKMVTKYNYMTKNIKHTISTQYL